MRHHKKEDQQYGADGADRMINLLGSEEFLLRFIGFASIESGATKVVRNDRLSIAYETQDASNIRSFKRYLLQHVEEASPKEITLTFSIPSLRIALLGKPVLQCPLEDLPKFLHTESNASLWIVKARLELGI